MGLKHFKCPRGGYSHLERRESAGKAGRNSGNAQIGCRWVWGTGGTLLVLSGALILTGTLSSRVLQHITILS